MDRRQVLLTNNHHPTSSNQPNQNTNNNLPQNAFGRQRTTAANSTSVEEAVR